MGTIPALRLMLEVWPASQGFESKDSTRKTRAAPICKFICAPPWQGTKMTDESAPTETLPPHDAGPSQQQVFGGFLTDADLRTLLPGQKMDLPIIMTPGLPRLFADTVGVSITMSQFVDLTFLTMRQNLVSQNFTVGVPFEGGLQVKAGNIGGGPVVLEEGSVRLAPKTAVALIGALVAQLKLVNLISEESLADILKAPAKE